MTNYLKNEEEKKKLCKMIFVWICSFWVDRHIPTILLVYWNTFWITEAWNRLQNGPKMVVTSTFFQPYSQYSVRVQAYVRSHLSFVIRFSHSDDIDIYLRYHVPYVNADAGTDAGATITCLWLLVGLGNEMYWCLCNHRNIWYLRDISFFIVGWLQMICQWSKLMLKKLILF